MCYYSIRQLLHDWDYLINNFQNSNFFKINWNFLFYMISLVINDKLYLLIPIYVYRYILYTTVTVSNFLWSSGGVNNRFASLSFILFDCACVTLPN